MTIPKPTPSRKPQIVEDPSRKLAPPAQLNFNQVPFKDIYKLLHVGDQAQDMNVVNQADWDSVIHGDLTGESCGEHMEGILEDQEQRPLHKCTQESAYHSSNRDAGHLSLHQQFDSHQVIHPETQGHFGRPQEGFSNYTALYQCNQGQINDNLHALGTHNARTVYAHHVGKFGRMIQQAEMQGPASAHIDQSWQPYGIQSQEFFSVPEGHRKEHILGTCSMDSNVKPFQGNLIQNTTMHTFDPSVTEAVGFRTDCDMRGTSQQEPTAGSQKQFPFQISPGIEFCTANTGSCMVFAPGSDALRVQGCTTTQDIHQRFPSYVGSTSGETFQSAIGISSTDSPVSQIPVTESSQNSRRQWVATNNSYRFTHGNTHISEVNPSTKTPSTCALENMASSYKMGAYAPPSVHQLLPQYTSFNPAEMSHHSVNIEEGPVQSPFLERISYDDTVLPSSFQNLEGPDAHSKQMPSSCSKASIKTRQQRLTLLRKNMRNGLIDGTNIYKGKAFASLVDGVGGRLSALRSEMRKGNHIHELLANGELQTKQRRKKIRCKVQRDITKPRGRRRGGKAKDIPQGSEMHRDEGSTGQDGKSAEAAISSVEETTGFPEIGPFVEITTKVTLDGQASFALVVPEKTFYSEENGIARSGFFSNRLETSSWNEHSNLVANYGTGHDLEKPPLIDYLALSDERHRTGEMDLGASSSTHESQRLASFGCQDLILYDQTHCQPQSKALPLCLFSGETSSTGSTDIVPTRGRSTHLPLANVNSEDNLQLVLYNQKRDIVVSKLRTYKKIRAKVQLDPESQRVWLLLENGAGPQPDSDPGRARYWEKQRDNMRRKVEHFIEKMHNVQGDRKFSPWKGSIVDSVVGAFLTQNVSDHLSSSAFMSVASRFPPISRSNTLVACPDVMGTFPFENQSEVETLPSIMERVSIGVEENMALSKQGDSDCNDHLYVDESVAAEVGLGEAPGYTTMQLDNRQPISPCIHGIKEMVPSYTNALITTPDSQPFGKNQQYHLLTSDDERNSTNSTCDIEEDANDGGRLEEISGAFRQHCTIHNSKARRMLNFGAEFNKQQPELCSTLEPDKQVSLALMHVTETASDNISDQQSETESAVGSFGSVHSVQDSNFQISIVQEGNLGMDLQANTIQASNRELNVAAVAQINPKTGKKRPMSLSSISGMERALLEANQRGRKKNHNKDWESVRKQALGISPCARDNFGGPEPRSSLHEDSVNWDAVRLADLGQLADTIKERGMHHVLSGRIKAFLTTLHEEHGSIDLEWLRNLSSERAREYLMSIHGLGVKSVECIRLLTLHHLAFPVDTNVGRICVRLGWVPIEPLPEEVQLHLVELYPIQETIQKYLWPRLCTLDQRTLYELHYQLITFGKVFCTKSKPNCNACPLRTECKHFASAYASAKPLLMGPKQDESNRICSGTDSKGLPALGMDAIKTALLEYPQDKAKEFSLSMEAPIVSEIDSNTAFSFEYHQPPFGASYREFYVEEPASPERTFDEEIMDIEDMGKPMYIYNNYKDYSIELLGDNISLDHPDQSHVSIGFSADAKSVNIQSTNPANAQFDALPSILSKDVCCSPHQSSNTELASKNPCFGSQSITSCVSPVERCSYSTDLIVEVAQTAIVPVPEAAQIPVPKLKSVGRLRTIHYVYELPDDHSLLKMIEVDAREKDDPCCYLLAIWSPGEIPESQQEIDEFCGDDYAAHCAGSADETVAGTLLIPCRTAMHGSFPLNGTYFQVNEVFADHASSLRPLQVPRSLIWSLRRRFVYFGTSVPNIFKGLSTDEIKDCFWRGHVCVRGFDRRSRAPKPLVCRLHFPISKQQQKPSKTPGRKKGEKVGFSSISHT